MDKRNDHTDLAIVLRRLAAGVPQRVWMVVAAAVTVALTTIWLGHRFDPPFLWPTHDQAVALAGRFIDAAQGTGALGVIGVIAAYALGVVLCLPNMVMTLAATMIFGFWAIPIVLAGRILGMALAFDIARTTLREDFCWFFDRIPGGKGINDALRDDGFWIVFLMRLSPAIPSSGQNYMFGTLHTPTGPYFVGSVLAIIPGTIVNVTVFHGAEVLVASDAGGINPIKLALGLAATIAIVVILYKAVRAQIRIHARTAGHLPAPAE